MIQMKNFEKPQHFEFFIILNIYSIVNKDVKYQDEMEKIISKLNELFGDSLLIEKIRERRTRIAIIDDYNHFTFQASIRIDISHTNYDEAMKQVITKIKKLSYKEVKIIEISGKQLALKI